MLHNVDIIFRLLKLFQCSQELLRNILTSSEVLHKENHDIFKTFYNLQEIITLIKYFRNIIENNYNYKYA